MPFHVVKQGECMSSMADQYGFFWETLWNLPENAELSRQRANPNVLLPGDRVFIPEIRPKVESGETAKVHTFRLKGVPVKLNLRLLDEFDEPREGVKYTLTVDGQKFSGTTPADGWISQVIPPRASRGRLSLETGEEYDLELGHINPVELTSGVQGRLQNLGYLEGDLTGKLDEETREAIRRFQGDHGLEETGEPDDATREALLAAHES